MQPTGNLKQPINIQLIPELVANAEAVRRAYDPYSPTRLDMNLKYFTQVTGTSAEDVEAALAPVLKGETEVTKDRSFIVANSTTNKVKRALHALVPQNKQPVWEVDKTNPSNPPISSC